MMKTRFEDIDLKIEKLVFLLNADEGNPGIYELTWELGRFDLTIEDRYKFTDYGEVFTNRHEVTAILDLVRNAPERIQSRFIENACVSGGMFVQMIQPN